MCTVWSISVPFVLMYSRPVQPDLDWRDGLGIALFSIGFLVETVADAQKFSFKNSPGNRSKMCTVGLWRFSRHPNYFGEALVWWGIWSMCTASWNATNPLMYISVLSPVYVCTILLFLSGVPTLEGPWDKRYGKDPEYRAYKRSVPPFVMLIPAIYAPLPLWVKRVFCCEFPFYWSGFPPEDSLVNTEVAARASGNIEEEFGKGYQVGGSSSN